MRLGSQIDTTQVGEPDWDISVPDDWCDVTWMRRGLQRCLTSSSREIQVDNIKGYYRTMKHV